MLTKHLEDALLSARIDELEGNLGALVKNVVDSHDKIAKRVAALETKLAQLSNSVFVDPMDAIFGSPVGWGNEKEFPTEKNASAHHAATPIPPLPQHKRFRNDPIFKLCDDQRPQFDISHDQNPCWVDIERLSPRKLEECCALARVWWINAARSTQTDNSQECVNDEKWSDYLKSRTVRL